MQPTANKDLTSLYKGRYTFISSGPLSNWAPAQFVAPTLSGALAHLNPETIPEAWNFSSSEQYIMLQKALCFGDWDVALRILNTDSPSDQKGLGRTVKNFESSKWDAISRACVYEGCFHKFTQNREAHTHLLNTLGTLLVEDSRVDCLWGVGLSVGDPEICYPEKWRGFNWLGEVLTLLRENLLSDGKHMNPYLKELGRGVKGSRGYDSFDSFDDFCGFDPNPS